MSPKNLNVPSKAHKFLLDKLKDKRTLQIYKKFEDNLNINKNERNFKFLNIENIIKKDHIFNKPEALFPRYEK